MTPVEGEYKIVFSQGKFDHENIVSALLARLQASEAVTSVESVRWTKSGYHLMAHVFFEDIIRRDKTTPLRAIEATLSGLKKQLPKQPEIKTGPMMNWLGQHDWHKSIHWTVSIGWQYSVYARLAMLGLDLAKLPKQ